MREKKKRFEKVGWDGYTCRVWGGEGGKDGRGMG